jgi:plastocyanin
MKLALFVAILAAAFGCAGSPLEVKPFEISLEAAPLTTVPGDTVVFVVRAQGGSLIGVEMQYGDNSGDQFGTGGATSARVTFKHVYGQRGTYQVRATVTDALAGVKEANVDIRVN